MKPSQLIILLFAVIACQPNKNSQTETVQADEQPKSSLDTIVYSMSDDQTVYLGSRIFPETNLTDSAATDFFANSEIASVILVGDTIFVFLNNNLLLSEANEYFPQINDSLLQYHYPKIYDVEIDDDLPYFTYLRSDKDNLTLIKNRKSGEFHWEGAVVTDTVLSFMNGIKIGSSKATIFDRLNITGVDKSDLTIILAQATSPDQIWYESYKSALKKYNHLSIPALLRIENNILTGILIDWWICHGKVDEQLLNKLNGV